MVKRLLLRLSALLAAGLCAASCSTCDFGGMIAAASSVQERFRNSMEPPAAEYYPANVVSDAEDYDFLVATDLHIREGQWPRVERFFSFAAADGGMMTLLLGDYMYQSAASLELLVGTILSHEGLRVFPAIGNHDVYQDGYDKNYRDAFGPTCYSFTVTTPSARDLFIALDSANGTLGRDQYRWLETLLDAERGACRHCFVFTHANFFNPPGYPDVISTYPIEEQMKLLDLFARRNVTCVLTGHSHLHDETTVRGVRYVTVGAWLEGAVQEEYCRVTCRAGGEVILGFQPVG